MGILENADCLCTQTQRGSREFWTKIYRMAQKSGGTYYVNNCSEIVVLKTISLDNCSKVW